MIVDSLPFSLFSHLPFPLPNPSRLLNHLRRPLPYYPPTASTLPSFPSVLLSSDFRLYHLLSSIEVVGLGWRNQQVFMDLIHERSFNKCCNAVVVMQGQRELCFSEGFDKQVLSTHFTLHFSAYDFVDVSFCVVILNSMLVACLLRFTRTVTIWLVFMGSASKFSQIASFVINVDDLSFPRAIVYLLLIPVLSNGRISIDKAVWKMFSGLERVTELVGQARFTPGSDQTGKYAIDFSMLHTEVFSGQGTKHKMVTELASMHAESGVETSNGVLRHVHRKGEETVQVGSDFAVMASGGGRWNLHPGTACGIKQGESCFSEKHGYSSPTTFGGENGFQNKEIISTAQGSILCRMIYFIGCGANNATTNGVLILKLGFKLGFIDVGYE